MPLHKQRKLRRDTNPSQENCTSPFYQSLNLNIETQIFKANDRENTLHGLLLTPRNKRYIRRY